MRCRWWRIIDWYDISIVVYWRRRLLWLLSPLNWQRSAVAVGLRIPSNVIADVAMALVGIVARLLLCRRGPATVGGSGGGGSIMIPGEQSRRIGTRLLGICIQCSLTHVPPAAARASRGSVCAICVLVWIAIVLVRVADIGVWMGRRLIIGRDNRLLRRCHRRRQSLLHRRRKRHRCCGCNNFSAFALSLIRICDKDEQRKG